MKHDVHNQLTRDKYEEILNKQLKQGTQVIFNSIRSKNHKIIKPAAWMQPSMPSSPFATKQFWRPELESFRVGITLYTVDDVQGMMTWDIYIIIPENGPCYCMIANPDYFGETYIINYLLYLWRTWSQNDRAQASVQFRQGRKVLNLIHILMKFDEYGMYDCPISQPCLNRRVQ